MNKVQQQPGLVKRWPVLLPAWQGKAREEAEEEEEAAKRKVEQPVLLQF